MLFSQDLVSRSDPRADRLRDQLELSGKIFGRPSRTDQINILGIRNTSGESFRVSTKPGQSQFPDQHSASLDLDSEARISAVAGA